MRQTADGATEVCVLTAPGRGAVAVLAVRGPRALPIVEAVFRPASPPTLRETVGHRPRFGRVGDSAGTDEEVIVVPLSAEPPVLEIHCHGGRAAIAMVLEVLRRQGAVVIDSKRWIGTRPPSRQALELLSRAPTLRTAEHLLDQADGALDRELARIAERAIEAPEAAREALANLLEHARVGLRLIEGWKIALAGPPNVGKSCLLNALAGYPRAIVDPTPGTTRDAVTHQTAFDGWPVQVVDTAGLRQTDQPLEALGIAQARRLHQRTDLVLLVLDGSIPLSQNERDLLRRYPQALVVANKADRPAAWSVDALGALAVSALSGAGLPELTARVARDLVPRPPRELTPLPFLDSHVRRLRAFQTLLKRGQGDRVTALIRRWLDPSIASWSRGGMESVPGRHRREERVCRRPDGPGRA